jgi:septal ring factor EnvC (AmiA/AmiB activator)
MFRLQIHLATEEDKAHGLDKWASLFKAKTWEELKAMSETNEYISEAAQTMYILSSDKRIIEQCRRRKEVEQEHKYYESTIAKKDNQIAEQKSQIAEQKSQINKQKSQINEQKSQIADKDNQIAELNAKLAYYESQQNK